MKTLASFAASLLLVLSACKGDKDPAAKPDPAEPAAKPIEAAAEPAVTAPAPAPTPTAVKPAATWTETTDALPDLKGLRVGSSGEDVHALMDNDDNWTSLRNCDSCSDGDYLYGDPDDPSLTVTVKNNKVSKITKHAVDLSNTRVAKEAVGDLRLDDSAKLVSQVLGKPKTKTPLELRGETGRYETVWDFPNEGMALSLGSETEKGELKVVSIHMSAPSKRTTKRGIGIGSTRAQVEKVYADVKSERGAHGESFFYAGELDGLVVFRFTDGKVLSISVERFHEDA